MDPSFPTSFALKSSVASNKYLAYVPEHEIIPGLLKFSVQDVKNTVAKFDAVKAKTAEGLVHIKSSYNNKFWRKWTPDHSWIAAEADEPEEDQSKWTCTLFKPIFASGGGNSVQFMHVQLGGYVACSLRAEEPFKYCLFVTGKEASPDKLDTFAITNLAPVSREISDITFSIKDAKVRDKTTIKLATGVAVNNNDHFDEAKAVTLDYATTETSTWNGSSGSLNSDVRSNLKSAIPAIINDSIQLSGHEFVGPYQWGKPIESKNRVVTTYTIVEAPRTMMIVTLKATRASFDVPFSYTVHDTLADGTVVESVNNDGVYTGFSIYNLRYEAERKRRGQGIDATDE